VVRRDGAAAPDDQRPITARFFHQQIPWGSKSETL